MSTLTEQSQTSGSTEWRKIDCLKIASLFTGAGGLDLGLINASHDIVFSNDIDVDSVETYKQNISKNIVLGDVKDVDPADIPNHDLLVAGLPCQGFSRANTHRVAVDERNSLYLQFVRILRSTLPPFFMIENVRGIAGLNGGGVFEEILSALRSSGPNGYIVQHRLINAADYGVPQTRIRMIIVGVRGDLSSRWRYRFPPSTHSKQPEMTDLRPWITISEALDGLPEPGGPGSPVNHIGSQYKVVNRDYTGHRVTNPNKPSPTILARGNGGGGVCAIPHPNNNRRLTVRESALIQTFPLNFSFAGKLMSSYRQVGNAVPVKLGERLGSGFERLAV